MPQITKAMNTALAALAIGAVAVTAGPAAAQTRGGGHGGHGGYGGHGGFAHGGFAGRGGHGYYGGGYRGYGGHGGGWGYGWPYAYGWYGAAPWAWAPYSYGYAYPYAYSYYDQYDDYVEPDADYAPPPPPPRAAPAPAYRPAAAPRPATAPRSFVLYFPFDSSELTGEAKKIVDDAARYDAAHPDAKATIVGYTDASGSEGYNQALSEHRSQIVREALQADGVQGDSIDMAWRGKHDLAVQTPDGVREPANRRVTIVIKSGADTLAGGRQPYAGDDEVEDDSR